MITKKNYKFASPVTPVFQKPAVLKSPEWPDLDFGSFEISNTCSAANPLWHIGCHIFFGLFSSSLSVSSKLSTSNLHVNVYQKEEYTITRCI